MEETVLDETLESTAHNVDTFEGGLLTRMHARLQRGAFTTSYKRSLASFKWDKVAFDDHTPEECKAKWKSIEARLRVVRTLPELVEDAIASKWDVRRVQKLKQGVPPRPNVFMEFRKEVMPKLQKQHPDWKMTQFSKKVGEMFQNLSKREKTALQARVEKEYNEKLEAYRQEQDELPEPPKRPDNVIQIYRRKHPNLSHVEAKAIFDELSDGKKLKYIKKAEKGMEEYEEAVKAYQAQYPHWRPLKTAGSGITKAQQNIAHPKANNSNPKAPRNAYAIFRSELAQTEKVNATEAAQRWKAADERTRGRYTRLAQQEKEKYDEFVNALPPEEQEKLRHPRRAKQVKKKTAKELYLEEKMPDDFEFLSKEQWERVLVKKFKNLPKDEKEIYEQKAKEYNKSLPPAQTASRGRAQSEPPGGGLSNGIGGDNRSPNRSIMLNNVEWEDAQIMVSDVEESTASPTKNVHHRQGDANHPERVAAAPPLPPPTPSHPTVPASKKQKRRKRGESVSEPSAAGAVTNSGAAEPDPAPLPPAEGRSTASDSGSSPRKKHKSVRPQSPPPDSEEQSPSKKKRKKHIKSAEEEETPTDQHTSASQDDASSQEEAPKSAKDMFIRMFLKNYAQFEGEDDLTPKQRRKKAKERWLNMDLDVRAGTERRFLKKYG